MNYEIKRCKEMYYKNYFYENEGKVKKTWNLINELTSRKQKIPDNKEINVNGTSLTDPEKRVSRIE